MTNRSKSIGTRFETQCARWLTERLGYPVERRALHGNRDVGDLAWLIGGGGARGIVECKADKAITAASGSERRRQTVAERDNAGAQFAWLVIKTANVGMQRFERTRVDVQLGDLAAMGCFLGKDGDSHWMSMDLETACSLLEDATDA